ncbi:MAG: hypothetical protein MZV64_64020 [Ignavibacteriales bacterium]|nr:hypothetical protein [Ignavibacteriales bacterium]
MAFSGAGRQGQGLRGRRPCRGLAPGPLRGFQSPAIVTVVRVPAMVLETRSSALM